MNTNRDPFEEVENPFKNLDENSPLRDACRESSSFFDPNLLPDDMRSLFTGIDGGTAEIQYSQPPAPRSKAFLHVEQLLIEAGFDQVAVMMHALEVRFWTPATSGFTEVHYWWGGRTNKSRQVDFETRSTEKIGVFHVVEVTLPWHYAIPLENKARDTLNILAFNATGTPISMAILMEPMGYDPSWEVASDLLEEHGYDRFSQLLRRQHDAFHQK